MELVTSDRRVYTFGWTITRLSAGLVENLACKYGAETSPAALRGMIISIIFFSLGLAIVYAQVVKQTVLNSPLEKAWMIAVAVQLIPTVLLIVMFPVIPVNGLDGGGWGGGGQVDSLAESPRWLICKGKDDKVIAVLDKLRRKENTTNGTNILEVQAVDEAYQQALLCERNA